MNHLSNEELNELIDDRILGSNRELILAHLEQCPLCSSAYHQMVLIDRAARRQPIEMPGASFVESVMKNIVAPKARPQRAGFERILKYCANLFALIVVACLGYGIVSLVNHYLPGTAMGGVNVDQLVNVSTVRNEISGGWNSLHARLHQYLVNLLPQGRLPLWVYALWSIMMVVIIEKIGGKRLRSLSHMR